MWIDAFIEWYLEKIKDFLKGIGIFIVRIISWTIVILLFPLWIIPFIYWYFFVK